MMICLDTRKVVTVNWQVQKKLSLHSQECVHCVENVCMEMGGILVYNYGV